MWRGIAQGDGLYGKEDRERECAGTLGKVRNMGWGQGDVGGDQRVKGCQK